MREVLWLWVALLVLVPGLAPAQLPPGPDPESYPLPCANTITAQVIALDQSIFYNRFGAFDPDGMVFALARNVEPENGATLAPGNARLKGDVRPRPLVLRVNEGDCLEITLTNLLDPTVTNNVATRSVSMNASGVELAEGWMVGTALGNHSAPAVAPGESVTFTWYGAKRGAYSFNSLVSATGGEGDGGSQAHGLFGAIVVEPSGSTWYRSQVGGDVLAAATIGTNPNGTPLIDYEALLPDGTPALRILDDTGEIVHSDLNAIIAGFTDEDCAGSAPSGTCGSWYREFAVMFHDEIGIRQGYIELKNDDLWHGVRDGFAINYGSGGLGAEVFAVRLGEGPGANCGECKFEEFFLESWVNGDPAMPTNKDPVTGVATEITYPSDPSNVHHSYIGDPVRFENLHVGAETHVFHLHAHQWLYQPRNDGSTYLDSQSLSPGTSYSYEINYGGGGNRNLLPGDSIFHCHLYPHFAQGMWELWRSHDVFESGTPDRNLPDGEIPVGTPNVALVPIPGRPMPPMPTPDFRGYPFYIPGTAGRRSPQPPLELEQDGGLPRHTVVDADFIDGLPAIAPSYLADPVHQRVVAANPSPNLLAYARKIESAELNLLPDDGTPDEQTAMDFHAGLLNPNPALGAAIPVTTDYHWPAVGYPTFDSDGTPGYFLVNGRPPQPGAPYADPCPPTFVDGAGQVRPVPTRTYRAAYIQFDMTINQLGWHDRQARIAVLNEDVFPTLAGTRPPQPLFFRANSGDCIVFKPTNLIPANLNVDDFQIFTPTDILGQHIHLVKFDVTASDGSGNGWNYEDGVFSPEEVRERIAANNHHIDPDGDGNPDVPGVLLSAETHPYFGSGPGGAWIGAQTSTQRWWADPLVNNAGQDRTIRSVFTHDHFGPSSHQQHGLYALLVIEPTDSIWTMPDGSAVMGTRFDGGPTNWAANILAGLSGAESVREFVFETGDMMPTYDSANLPVGAPGIINAPEAISTGGGSVTINYRNDPIGHPLDNTAAFSFSSALGGDPGTFVGGAYPGDRINISLAHGAQEDQHSFTMHGARWLQEPSNPDSGYTNMQEYGISEHFEMYFRLGDGFRHTTGPTLSTDYLVGSMTSGDIRDGMWGVIRAHGTPQPSLAPLPNNPAWQTRPAHPLALGICPTGPGAPPKKSFTIQAWRVSDIVGTGGLVLNDRFGWHDPNALVFIHAADLPALQSGQRELEPLVMRVNAGDCIEVMLQNMLPPTLPQLLGAETGSSRVSLHPQLLSYDVGSADGAVIGRNPDTTVGAGETRLFAWYAGEIAATAAGGATWTPVEFGVTNLRSFGDPQGHTTHGLYGVCIVEPQGATWVDPEAGGPAHGYEADVLDASGELLFREYVLQWMDAVPQVTRANGTLIDPDTLRNLKGYNYRSEPLWSRMGVLDPNPFTVMRGIDQTWTLSSTHPLVGCGGLPCGDPATPTCTVEAGSPLMFRVAQAGGQVEVPHSFTLSNHNWQQQPWTDGSKKIGHNPRSRTIGAVGNITAGSHENILTIAGGAARAAGDYIYRANNNFAFSGGCWGILRVTPYVRIPALPVESLICAGGVDGVAISWSNPGTDTLAIEVRRGGTLIANLPGDALGYVDPALAPGSYQYSVITVNSELPSPPVTCNAEVRPVAPSSVTCTPIGGIVDLHWSYPAGAAFLELVRVDRDGQVIATLPWSVTGFQDVEAGFGTHSYEVRCISSGVPSDAAACLSTLVPPAVSALTVTIDDPCTGALTASWVNLAVFESISVSLGGAVIATLPGEATAHSFTIPPGSAALLCVTGSAGGLTSALSCQALAVPTVPAIAVTGIQCTADAPAQTATVTWTPTTSYGSLQVQVDGVLVAVLPGTATSATVPIGFGSHTIAVAGTTICGAAVSPATCTASIAPPAPVGLAVLAIDPCNCTMSASWLSPIAYDTIALTLDGAPLATLPGTSTVFPFALPGGSGALCVAGILDGVASAPACAAAVCPGIAANAVTNLACSVDAASLTATLTWQLASPYEQLEVRIDGATVATLSGTATTATVPLFEPGPFDACIAGTTICGDAIPFACTSAVAPFIFRRGDANADGTLNLADVTGTLAVVFQGQPHLCWDALDTNNDGQIDVSDPIRTLLFLFAGGPPPAGGLGCAADPPGDPLDCTSHPGCP